MADDHAGPGTMSQQPVLVVTHELRISGETMVWLDDLVLRAAAAMGQGIGQAIRLRQDASGEGGAGAEVGSSLSKPSSPEPDSADGAAGHQAKATAPVRDPGVEGRPVEPGPPVSDAGQGGTPFGMAASGAHPASDPAPVAGASTPEARPAQATSAAPAVAALAETSAPADHAGDTAGAASHEKTAAPRTAPAEPARGWTKEQIETAVAMKRQGKRDDVIAKAIGRSQGAVAVKFSVLRRNGISLAVPQGTDQAPPAPPATPITPATPDVPLRRSAAEILRWCALVKLAMPRLDLDRINAFRRNKNMPPFELVDVPAPGPATVQPHRASKASIWQWGRMRGVCQDVFDLDEINDKARALGLPPFEVTDAAPAGRGAVH